MQKIKYAGAEFRTQMSQRLNRFDNSKIRHPFTLENAAGKREIVDYYGQIDHIYVHTAWKNGPRKCVLDVKWYEHVSINPISGNPLVRHQGDDAKVQWVSIENCYQRPVAVWRHDAFRTRDEDEYYYLEVIDRNATELEDQ